MDYDKLLNLIEVIESSRLTKFTYKKGDTEINIEKESEIIHEIASTCMESVRDVEQVKNLNTMKNIDEEKYEYIKSPLVGTFYNSPSPNEEPYILPGARISKGQKIGIIEAMKIMNEITSEHEGIIEEILIENEETVEYGQCLIKIKLD